MTARAIPVLEEAERPSRPGQGLATARRGRGAGRALGGPRQKPSSVRSSMRARRATRARRPTLVGLLAMALYFGPTPAEDAIARCTDLLAEVSERPTLEAAIWSSLAGLLAMRGRLRRGPAAVGRTRASGSTSSGSGTGGPCAARSAPTSRRSPGTPTRRSESFAGATSRSSGWARRARASSLPRTWPTPCAGPAATTRRPSTPTSWRSSRPATTSSRKPCVAACGRSCSRDAGRPTGPRSSRARPLRWSRAWTSPISRR